MPITPEEFKRGKVKGSLEDLILDVLSDGNAYTLSELEKELGIGQREEHYLSDATYEELLNGIKNSANNLSNSLIFFYKLEDMTKEGKIKSAYVEDKDGLKNTYYMRTEIHK